MSVISTSCADCGGILVMCCPNCEETEGLRAKIERLEKKNWQYYDQLCNGWEAIISIQNEETAKRMKAVVVDIVPAGLDDFRDC